MSARDLDDVVNDLSKTRDLVDAGFLAAHGLASPDQTNAFATLMSVISDRLEELEGEIRGFAHGYAEDKATREGKAG